MTADGKVEFLLPGEGTTDEILIAEIVDEALAAMDDDESQPRR